MKTKTKLNGYRDLLLFFIPLMITNMLLMGSHSIVSSALARTDNGTIALAAYAVSYNVICIFEAPLFGIQRLFVPLLDDRRSFKVLTNVTLITLLSVLAVIFIVAFTPISEFIFINIVGVNPNLYPEVIRAFRLFLILPAASVPRCIFQSVLVVNKRTSVLTISMVSRLLGMLLLSHLFISTGIIKGVSVGILVLVGGMAIESFLCFMMARKFLKKMPEEPRSGEPLTYKAATSFFIPIVGALFLHNFIRNFINAGLARSANPEVALAAFQVAYSLAWIVVGISFSVHQLVLVFAKDAESKRRVSRFVLVLGLLGTGILLLLSATPLGEWVLLNFIKTDPLTTREALIVMLPMAFIPLVVNIAEMFSGFLMQNRSTTTLTWSKVAHIAIVIIMSLVIMPRFPEQGAFLSGLAMLLGSVGEFVVLYIKGRQYLN